MSKTKLHNARQQYCAISIGMFMCTYSGMFICTVRPCGTANARAVLACKPICACVAASLGKIFCSSLLQVHSYLLM